MPDQACAWEGSTRQIHDRIGNISETRHKEMGSEKTLRIPETGPQTQIKNAEIRLTSHRCKKH